MPWTNRGAYLAFNTYLSGVAAPTTFYVALCTNTTPPTVDTNTLSQLEEIAAGNGYTAGGLAVARDTTDWDSRVEDDTDDRSEFQIKDLVWTASGGAIPDSGAGARWATLLTDEATVGTRQVILYWDLVLDRTVSSGQTFTLANAEVQGDTVP